MPRLLADNFAPLPAESGRAQASRARSLLAMALLEARQEVRFTLEVAALHLARAIPDYWYTLSELVAQEAQVNGREARALTERLRDELETIFSRARHYGMLDGLRRWDFHWEPLVDPLAYRSDDVVRRGAPMRLTTGPSPNSVAGVVGLEPVFSGSGRRIGRGNYYEIQHRAFVDEDAQQSLPLRQAVAEFLDDLPACQDVALAIPEIKGFLDQPIHSLPRPTFPDWPGRDDA